MLDLLHLRLPQNEAEEQRKRLSDFMISRNTLSATVQNSIITPKLFSNRYIPIAAAIIVMTTAALIFLSPVHWFSKNKIKSEWISYTSPVSQRSILHLNDGSEVTLNSGSTLSYPKIFDQDKRMVKLSGQAFFEVAHDASHPFIVQTGKIQTKVLGTEFNVSNYKAEKEVTVALVRGSVQIKTMDKNQDSILLKPGERMTYHSGSGKMIASSFDTEIETGWKEGNTSFKAADFKTISSVFEKNFGYKLLLPHQTIKINYTGTFKNESPLHIIKAICYSLNLTYTIQNNTIILSSSNYSDTHD